MKLRQAEVRMFRNILDSTPVDIQQDVTCIVGKNESGKTAFLQALYRLKPARSNAPFLVHFQYPAWLEKRHRQEGKTLEHVRPITAVFDLDDEDKDALAETFGPKVVADSFSVARNYKGEWQHGRVSPFNEREAVQHVVSTIAKATKSVAKDLKTIERFKDLAETAAALKQKGAEHPDALQTGTAIEAAIKAALGGKDFGDVAWAMLEGRIPTFFYFAEYARLPYSVKIRELLQADETQLAAMTDDLLTARSLLKQAGAEKEYLLNPDYERRKRELENVANAITADVSEYWTQNDKLRVLPDITHRNETQTNGQNAIIDELKTRIWDERHGLSLPFNEHSTGFQWFFSFLAAFSEFEHNKRPVIVLLDEPALGLHARAQADFLRFIEERLAKRCQVIYSTHSPWMVQPKRLDRVRLAEDKGKEFGTKITKDVLTTDRDTLFPLQSALGYDLAQHLFVAVHNLVVEGTGDYTYLVVLSDFLKDQGKVGLDDRWSVVPVGGADLIPTFVALLGHHLDITILIDSRREGNQRLQKLAVDGYLPISRLILLGPELGLPLADIEDVFEPDDYLRLYNLAFGSTVTMGDLKGSDPIVQRLARHQGVTRFDHGKPADMLLRKRADLLPQFTAGTLARFEKLFTRINSTLPA